MIVLAAAQGKASNARFPVSVAATGDIFVNRSDRRRLLDDVAPYLAAADLRFANCEGVYSNRPERAPSAGFAVVASPECADALDVGNFDIMSLANNHSVDGGHTGLLDTITVLQQRGIKTVGAGRNWMDARIHRVFERRGVRIAVLAYTSVFQPGYEARRGVPGVASLRALHTYYHADWDPYGRLEPGSQPQVRTFADPDDLDAMQDEIGVASREADIVFVSCHWGDSRRPAFLHDYEFAYGRAAIDAGASAVFGHHHHYLRAAEIYRGRPIFYGLGHLLFDLAGLEEVLIGEALERARSLGEHAIYPRGDPLFPFHPDARMTGIAFCEFDGDRVDAKLLPCRIGDRNIPVPASVAESHGQLIHEYLNRITADVGLHTRYTPTEIAGGAAIGLRIEYGLAKE